MAEAYLPIQGEPIPPQELIIPKAQGVAGLSTADPSLSNMRLVGCYVLTGNDQAHPERHEIVVADIEVDLGQHLLHDIRRIERVALVFGEHDAAYPEVLALRADFPLVPHCNVKADEELPRSLCLYDEPYQEVRLRWSPIGFIERLRWWLSHSASGTLHQDDQTLEPLLLGEYGPLILPPEVFVDGTETFLDRLTVARTDAGNGQSVFFATKRESQPNVAMPSNEYVATIIKGNPQEHGVIRKCPANLQELHAFLLRAEIDMRKVLKKRLKTWYSDKPVLASRLIIIVMLPKTRHQGSETEDADFYAFLTSNTVQEIGAALGIWEKHEDRFVPLITPSDDKDGHEVALLMLRPMLAFDRTQAALTNGLQKRCPLKIVAVGMGALGSQITVNLMRTGWGEWELIDHDYLLPHNLGRHILPGSLAGLPKAQGVAYFVNETIVGDPMSRPIVANILMPGDKAEEVQDSLSRADVILDMSASISVARHIARNVDSKARRTSAFLNPTGSDLVLLVEDTERKITLDALEMQYYRTLATEPKLAAHLRNDPARIRYAGSCRDVSAALPQDLVAFHAAIASRAIRKAADNPAASITIWSTSGDPSDLLHRIDVSPVLTVQVAQGDWTILTDQRVLDTILALREDHLPNETGGILVGSFDTDRRIAYVVDALPSPPDSQEWPALYVRGCAGLAAQVQLIETATAGWLGYVGEWHTHPDGISVRPSRLDRQAFACLSDQMRLEGRPALMLIAGESEALGWYLDVIPSILEGK